jgi:hypothetical protein
VICPRRQHIIPVYFVILGIAQIIRHNLPREEAAVLRLIKVN